MGGNRPIQMIPVGGLTLGVTCLVLILVDLLDGGVNAIIVESGEQPHDDNTRLIAEHRPAEMCLLIEHHEADDAQDEGEHADD